MTAARDQIRRYTFKLYPTRAQAVELQRQAALLAMLWNAALEQRETQWRHECERKAKGERKGLGKFDQSLELKHIRAADPEFAAMSSDTMALCVAALDDAFKAFFRRAKTGGGASSGYPKYKSPYAIENKQADCTIWHREHRKGWRLDACGKHFRLYAKGISGLISARGQFPIALAEIDLRDMRIFRESGLWFLSIVVRMEARRFINAAAPAVAIDFNLIDKFASVKNAANGECLPGWAGDFASPNERIRLENEEVQHEAGSDTSDGRSDGRFWSLKTCDGPGSDTSDCRSDGRQSYRGNHYDGGSDTSDYRSDGRLATGKELLTVGLDAIQSANDTRRKRGSYRWKQTQRQIARRKAKEARQRKDALHRWTSRLIAACSSLEITCPKVSEATRSAKGTIFAPGAEVKTVAKLNRHILAQAPAMAIQMLEYKAAEAGLDFVRLYPEQHITTIGKDLQAATKAARKARRTLKEACA